MATWAVILTTKRGKDISTTERKFSTPDVAYAYWEKRIILDDSIIQSVIQRQRDSER